MVRLISHYNQKLKTQPSRALLVGRLRRFEKALRRLRDECRRSADLMHDFLLLGEGVALTDLAFEPVSSNQARPRSVRGRSLGTRRRSLRMRFI